ncbi:hypothetical protein BKA63DRAFT_149201 [Paraphoma chrysanthemicola]|nr:hypothetical protein BKA63DRAFT_149201 [Paraphoma chrysanthemicola]
MELIKAMVVRSELFETAGVDPEDWWSAMTKENFDSDEDDLRDDDALHTTISLLSLLPNLKTLQLPSGWYDRAGQRWRNGWQDTKARLTAMTDALVAASKSSERALSKLQYIIPSTEQGYESRHDLQCLEPLMRMHALEEMYIVSCIAMDETLPCINRIRAVTKGNLHSEPSLQMFRCWQPNIICWRFSHVVGDLNRNTAKV